MPAGELPLRRVKHEESLAARRGLGSLFSVAPDRSNQRVGGVADQRPRVVNFPDQGRPNLADRVGDEKEGRIDLTRTTIGHWPVSTPRRGGLVFCIDQTHIS